MKRPSYKIFLADQAGSTNILLALLVTGVALASIKLLGQRADQQLLYVAHEKLQFELNLVKKVVASKAACEDWAKSSCVDGTKMNLKKSDGGVLSNANGKSKIANWNTKVECINSEYQVFASRLNDADQIIKDPLTNKPLDWAPALNLKQHCMDVSETIMVMGNPCYACDEGTVPFDELPDATPEVKAAGVVIAGLGTMSSCTKKSCEPGQRTFPLCPTGYYSVGYHIDRFGWAGIDFTKATICAKK